MALVRQAGPEPKVGRDVLLKMSQVGDYSSIGDDSQVLKSTIGRHCDIAERNLLQSSVVGDMTYTGADTSIMWAQVGKYCCVSRVVDIGGNEHDYRAASMMPTYRVRTCLAGKLSRHPDEEPVSVGNDVWIGQGVAIARKPGLVVGDGAVIGSGAVVTKSVPPYAIVAGVPARVLKFRFPEPVIERLLQARWWDWPEQAVLDNWELLSGELTPDVADRLVEIACTMERV